MIEASARDAAQSPAAGDPGDPGKSAEVVDAPTPQTAAQAMKRRPEFGGRSGLEPVRYGDWEKNGRCIDF